MLCMGRRMKMLQDGIQVDKNGRIWYNIDNRAEEMFTLSAPSPFPYGFFRDKFFTSFAALGAIGDLSLL